MPRWWGWGTTRIQLSMGLLVDHHHYQRRLPLLRTVSAPKISKEPSLPTTKSEILPRKQLRTKSLVRTSSTIRDSRKMCPPHASKPSIMGRERWRCKFPPRLTPLRCRAAQLQATWRRSKPDGIMVPKSCTRRRYWWRITMSSIKMVQLVQIDRKKNFNLNHLTACCPLQLPRTSAIKSSLTVNNQSNSTSCPKVQFHTACLQTSWSGSTSVSIALWRRAN